MPQWSQIKRSSGMMAGTMTEQGETIAAAGKSAPDSGRYPDIQTVNELFLRIAASGRSDAMLYQDEAGVWQKISSGQVYSRVRALAHVFLAWGIGRGDRIAILSENRWEWAITDFAVLAIGAVDVPIYPTLTSEQIGELLRDSGARVAFVSTRAMYDKVHAVRGETPLEHIVMMDQLGVPPDAVMFSMLTQSLDVQGAGTRCGVRCAGRIGEAERSWRR